MGEPGEESSLERAENLVRRDPRAAYDQARTSLEAATSSADPVTYHRWLLIRGVGQAFLGFTEEGARTLHLVRAWAEEHGESTLLARSHRHLSTLLGHVGDLALTLEHAVRAVELLGDDDDATVRGDHLLCLADALGFVGSYDEAIRRYHEAAALLAPCIERSLQVLNNLAYTQCEGGMTQDAVTTAERLLVEAAVHGLPLLPQYGDTIARTYMAAGRFDEAAAVLEPLCGETETREQVTGSAWSLVTLSSVRRLQGNFDDAQACLDRAMPLIDRCALPGRQIEALREQAELHAARGQFQSAYEVLVDLHRAEAALHSVERDSRARTLHAIFEATEARRRSDHFRELSVRDPLTGLHNRRHMDVVLADLLEQVAHDGASLTIGLVDLDHFKRINDTRSHAVGDEVLRVVAGILQRSAARAEKGLAVRMGGEEFLLLLPNVGRDEGIKHLESLRREVASQPWSEITRGMPVTASIGVATAPDDADERQALLKIADQNLYRAKNEGRDRVAS